MITVVAAVFSLGKMTKNNELVAIMASGSEPKANNRTNPVSVAYFYRSARD